MAITHELKLKIARIIDPDAAWGRVVYTGSASDNRCKLALERASEVIDAIVVNEAVEVIITHLRTSLEQLR